VIRTVGTNGVRLHVVDEGAGPPVVLCHGFPESSYSWRHQIPALVRAGYRVLVPDQRGYGGSDAPRRVEDYGIEQLTGDLLGLLDDIGEERAVFVGHDWGALVVWDLALLYPERVRAVVNLSVPLLRSPMPPVELFRQLTAGRLFYIVYFQDVGPAETELDADVRGALSRIYYWASGEGIERADPDPDAAVGATRWLDTMPAAPEKLPAWLSAADLDRYVDSFTRSGFFGPVSWYRNLDANWALTSVLSTDRIAMPVLFVAGDRDVVVTGNPGGVDAMRAALPDLRGVVMIPGVGHWTQQEAPEEVNDALLAFLGSL
jgi:pimeloyl-ACP methyl ester carboxylesterase